MRKCVLWAGALSCVMGLSLVACVPEAERQANEATNDGAVVTSGFDANPEEGLEGIANGMDALSEEYAPIVTTLEDGRQVQLTPDDDPSYLYGSSVSSYNTYYLDADNRGCASCHQDGLGDLLQNMTFAHWNMDNGLGTNIDVTDCLGCHTEQEGQTPVAAGQFGSIIHGIHNKDSFKGGCMSCHSATNDGSGDGLKLWEQAKYDAFSGMRSVENVQGDFSYDQDVVGGNNFEWAFWPGDVDGSSYPWLDEGIKNPEGDVAEYEDWVITVSGMVDTPKQWTLSELIAEAPSETFVSTMECEINPANGEWIGNAEITGIPVSWILNQVGVQEGAGYLTAYGADGYGNPAVYGSDFNDGNSIDNVENEGSWIVYEINGKPLSRMEGFPCRMWNQGHAISNSARWFNEIEVHDRGYHMHDGIGDPDDPTTGVPWTNHEETEATFYNKPTVAVMGTPEGLIIPAGEPYAFEGYAYAIDEQIATVEFSLDGGETWTAFDTSDSDKFKWVHWRFAYAPDDPGAYVLQVRATTSEGRISYLPDRVMVNVK